MLKKALICLFALVVVFGCANQQKDTTEKPSEETQQSEVNVPIEEISLTVTGMV